MVGDIALMFGINSTSMDNGECDSDVPSRKSIPEIPNQSMETFSKWHKVPRTKMYFSKFFM